MTTGLFWVLITSIPLFIGYIILDIYLAIKYGRTETISHGFWIVGQRVPLIPFVLGLIVGGLAVHFWSP